MVPRGLTLAGVAAAAALALPAAASAQAPGGVYVGTTTNPRAPQTSSPAFIRLGSDPTKPADARVFYMMRCDDGSFASNVFIYDDTDTIRGGRLRKVQRFEPVRQPDGTTLQETSTTRLTFTRTSVRGTFRMDGVKTLASGQVLRCSTGVQRLSLRRNGGYGGELLPQEQPAVLTRSGRDARLRVRFNAPCQPQGTLGRVIAVRAPLRDGRFAGEGEIAYTQPSDGTRVRLAYTVRGRVGATRVTGTLRVRVTSTRANGDVGPTCDSGEQQLRLRR
jgi:hypothetical protein